MVQTFRVPRPKTRGFTRATTLETVGSNCGLPSPLRLSATLLSVSFISSGVTNNPKTKATPSAGAHHYGFPSYPRSCKAILHFVSSPVPSSRHFYILLYFIQYSCLENPMDRGAWQALVHGVTKSRTQLSNYWGCALPSQNAPGKAPTHIHTTLRWGRLSR